MLRASGKFFYDIRYRIALVKLFIPMKAQKKRGAIRGQVLVPRLLPSIANAVDASHASSMFVMLLLVVQECAFFALSECQIMGLG